MLSRPFLRSPDALLRRDRPRIRPWLILMLINLVAAPHAAASIVASGAFGLLIGSFLNVVAYRLPIMKRRQRENHAAIIAGHVAPHQARYDLSMPRSACPSCGHGITALENIPVVSWILLAGRCSACAAPISWRYPFVEAVTGVTSAMAIWCFGITRLGLAALVLLYLTIAFMLRGYDKVVARAVR